MSPAIPKDSQYDFTISDKDRIDHDIQINSFSISQDIRGLGMSLVRVEAVVTPHGVLTRDDIYYISLFDSAIKQHFDVISGQSNHYDIEITLNVPGHRPFPFSHQSDYILPNGQSWWSDVKEPQIVDFESKALILGVPFALWDFQVDDFVNGTGNFREKNDPEQWISLKDLETQRFRDWVDQHYQCKCEPEIRRWDSGWSKRDESSGVVVDFGDMFDADYHPYRLTDEVKEKIRDGIDRMLKR